MKTTALKLINKLEDENCNFINETFEDGKYTAQQFIEMMIKDLSLIKSFDDIHTRINYYNELNNTIYMITVDEYVNYSKRIDNESKTI